jgi:hypothetical protein
MTFVVTSQGNYFGGVSTSIAVHPPSRDMTDRRTLLIGSKVRIYIKSPSHEFEMGMRQRVFRPPSMHLIGNCVWHARYGRTGSVNVTSATVNWVINHMYLQILVRTPCAHFSRPGYPKGPSS